MPITRLRLILTVHVVSDEKDKGPSATSSTTETPPSLPKMPPPPPGYKPPSAVKQNTPSTTSTNQPSAKDGITSSFPGVAMETESKSEVVGSKESRTVFVSNLAMTITEERLREKFSEVNTYSQYM